MFRYLVLGLLRDGQRRHGYAVMKAYRERSGLQVNTGSFYRQLQRLVAEGLIQTVANPADADPRRAPYQITETGETCFDAWLSGPTGAGVGRYEDELSSRAMFLANAEPDIVLRLLDAWKEELWLKSKVHERARSTLAPESDVPSRSFTAAARILPSRLLLRERADRFDTLTCDFRSDTPTGWRFRAAASRATVDRIASAPLEGALAASVVGCGHD